MKRSSVILTVVLSAAAALAPAQPARAQAAKKTVAQLEKQVRDNPISLRAKVDLAEAYLRQCELEKSLKVWRSILKADPKHERAAYVVGRLTLQALDLDSHLDVLQRLIETGITESVSGLLEAAGRRAASDPQKARILYLRGLLAWPGGCGGAVMSPVAALLSAMAPAETVAAPVPGVSRRARSRPIAPDMPTMLIVPDAGPPFAPGVPVAIRPDATAVSSFRAVMKLYPDTVWAGWSAIALARIARDGGDPAESRRLLDGLIDNRKIKDQRLKQRGRLELVLLASAGRTSREKVSALRRVLAGITAGPVKRRALGELVRVVTSAQGKWVAEAVDAAAEILKTNPPYDESSALLGLLLAAGRTSQDRPALDRLLVLASEVKLKDRALARELVFLRVAAALGRAVVAEDPARLSALLARADKALGVLGADGGVAVDRMRIRRLKGRRLLVEAQKLTTLQGAADALAVLIRAKDHYLAAMGADPVESLKRLTGIAKLLEHVREWQMAVALYREISSQLPHTVHGRGALLKVARLYENRLGAPALALETYAEYAARYPAELPYRQLAVGKRLKRLGYVNLVDFQKRNRLKVDGIFGPITREKLAEVEGGFDMISLARKAQAGILRGMFVHPAIFKIARRLDSAGRHHEAIGAYRLFLNLFPTKSQADDALLSVARLLRENLLFGEAIGAYTELMEDYPKGDMTSEAYIEAAGCLENLGRWQEAREMYQLYIRKFPRYKHVKLCKQRSGLLEEVQQYQDFVAGNPKNPKVPEAQYQIAVILYKRLGNHTKAAVEFVKVADRHAKHARAPEGLFSAGVAQLRAENFPAARGLFARLVAGYRESRLADDGQYWIGHTWEYSARAVGKLDDLRIVLKRRSLRGRSRLVGDMELRRHYFPKAKPDPAMPPDVWGGDTMGVLTSGSKRDRVNSDLFRAIRAYRKVAREFKMGDMAGNALFRIGTIYTKYLKDADEGIKAYQELLAHYPASKEATEALYEVGTYHLKKKSHDAAIKAYRRFIYNYPRDAKVQDAMLAIARSYAEKKDWNKALDAYQSYLSKFPKGKHAAQAKAQVEWIRMYHF